MGITGERIERIKKQAEILESCGKAAVGLSSELDALLQDNQQMEQQIERLNEANDRLRERLKLANEGLDDWRGNAEGFQPDAYMKLPLDADGEPIRFGDVVWYVGECVDIAKDYPLNVAGFVALLGATGTFIETREYPDGAIDPESLTHKKPEQADSWEKLEADLLRGSTADAYFQCGDISCSECPHSREVTGSYCWMNRNLDILARAKKLAGIEEEAER